MKLLKFLPLVALAALRVDAAGWIKLTTPHFELLTNNTEAEARATLDTFERVRGFFDHVQPLPQTSQLPLTLIAFATAREYQPYSHGPNKPAYATGNELHDYIVMSALGDFRDRAATHEYVHVLVRHSGLNFPAWLNEGMADVYSTLQERNGKLLVGAVAKDRTYSLTTGKWIPLRDLLTATLDSPLYNEDSRAGVFYGQSWLLAHMLMFSEPYAAKFPQFVAHLSKNGSSQAAISDVYNKSVADIQAAMNAYFRQPSLGAATFEPQYAPTVTAALTPATDFEVELTRIKLTRQAKDAETRLAKLEASHPANYDIDQTRAYLAMQNKEFGEAARYFQLAMEHGSPDWQAAWGYARTMEPTRNDVGPRIEALRKTVAGNPQLAEAHFLLALDLATTGDRDQARSELELARKLPLLPALQTKALELLASLDANAPTPEILAEDDDKPKRPVLQYNRPAPPKPQPAPAPAKKK